MGAVRVGEDLEVHEKLSKSRSTLARCVGAGRDQFGLGDRVYGEGIDDLSRAIGE